MKRLLLATFLMTLLAPPLFACQKCDTREYCWPGVGCYPSWSFCNGVDEDEWGGEECYASGLEGCYLEGELCQGISIFTDIDIFGTAITAKLSADGRVEENGVARQRCTGIIVERASLEEA
jgi:hypothetical protein